MKVQPSALYEMFRCFLHDLKQLIRTPGLVFFTTVPVLIWSLSRIVVPYINQSTMEYFSLDILDYAKEAYSFLILVPGMMGGMIAALLLMDDRDADLLAYYAVLPPGKRGYIGGRTLMLYVLSLLLTVLFMLLPGFTEYTPLQLLLIPPIAALGAPFITYLSAGFAGNKIEVLAILKTVSGLYLIPILQFFIPGKFHLLLGVFPPYWTTRLYFIAASTGEKGADLALSLAAALITHWLAAHFSTRFYLKRAD